MANTIDPSISELLNLGLVVIDKPKGPSSHKVAEEVKNILGVGKTGHLGTLDTNASGVLPVLLGRATATTSFFMKHDKKYTGAAQFEKPVTKKGIIDIFNGFTGEIWQIPPEGAAVARKKRKRKIHNLNLLSIKNKGKTVLFDVNCEAGTYIRTLIEDMGDKLGNKAKLIELRRTQVGGFDENKSVTLKKLSEAYGLWKNDKDETELRKILHPIEDALVGSVYKKIWLSDNAVESICSGAQPMMPGIARFESGIKLGDIISIMSLKNELVAFAEARISSEGMQVESKGQTAEIKRVIMERGKYPKSWKNK